MRVLLDTHCWLWMHAQSTRLSRPTRELLQDPANEVFLSAASSWEIATCRSAVLLPTWIKNSKQAMDRQS